MCWLSPKTRCRLPLWSLKMHTMNLNGTLSTMHSLYMRLHLSRSPSRSHRECQPGGASESQRLLVFDARKYHPLKGRNVSMFYSLLTAWQAPFMPGCFASASRWREKCQFVGMFLTHTAAKPDGFTHEVLLVQYRYCDIVAFFITGIEVLWTGG